MDVARAVEILRSAREGSDPKSSALEESELHGIGALTVIPAEGREHLESAARQLAAARDEVREARRAVDLLWGPRSGWANPDPAGAQAVNPLSSAQLRLQTAVRDLEARSLAQSALASMVRSSVTGSSLTATLSGRQLLADLVGWGARIGGLDLSAGSARIAELRGVTNTKVTVAGGMQTFLAGLEGMRVHPACPAAIRASSILLGLSETAATGNSEVSQRVGYFLSHFPGQGTTAEDRLAGASLLAAYDLPTDEILTQFESFRKELKQGPLGSSTQSAQVDLLAAALTGAGDPRKEDLVARTQTIVRGLGPVPSLSVAALIRAPYDVSELESRTNAGTEALRQLGYSLGDPELAGAALLAASMIPMNSFLPRLAALDPKFRALFPSAAIVDATLASLPLSTREVSLLFDYCVAAVSRASFFSDAPEVDYLALLLTAGMVTSGCVDSVFALGGPVASSTPGFLGGPLATSGGRPPGQAPTIAPGPLVASGLVGSALFSVLYVNHSFWLLRSYADYTRQHPLHSNAVPVYG